MAIALLCEAGDALGEAVGILSVAGLTCGIAGGISSVGDYTLGGAAEPLGVINDGRSLTGLTLDGVDDVSGEGKASELTRLLPYEADAAVI